MRSVATAAAVVADTEAPRVTQQDVDRHIVAEYFFTAEDGALGAGWLEPRHPSLGLLTFCVLVLRNGFTVTGESACASPEAFDAAVGCRVARQHAIAKVWQLLGYALRDRLAGV